MTEANPKKPPNSFLLFCDERMGAAGDGAKWSRALVRDLGQEWKKMTEAQKQIYKERADEEMRKFKEENPDYRYKRSKAKKQEKMPQGLSLEEAIPFLVTDRFGEAEIREFLKPGNPTLKFKPRNGGE